MTSECNCRRSRPMARLLLTDLRLAILSRRFFLSVGTSAVLYFVFIALYMGKSGGGFMTQLRHPTMGVLELMEASLRGLAVNLLFYCVIPVIPFGAAIYDDLTNGAFWFWAMRCGYRRYVVSKFIFCALSGFLTFFLSQGIVLCCMHTLLPLSININIPSNAYGHVYSSGAVMGYLVLLFVHLSLTAALYSSIGMLISFFSPSRFTTYVLPAVLFFFSSRFLGAVYAPLERITHWLTEEIYDGGTWFRSLLFKCMITAALIAIMMFASTYLLKRRSK